MRLLTTAFALLLFISSSAQASSPDRSNCFCSESVRDLVERFQEAYKRAGFKVLVLGINNSTARVRLKRLVRPYEFQYDLKINRPRVAGDEHLVIMAEKVTTVSISRSSAELYDKVHRAVTETYFATQESIRDAMGDRCTTGSCRNSHESCRGGIVTTMHGKKYKVECDGSWKEFDG